ncbi:MAG TPA: ABC transporter ATP-binding protein [Chloroflexi bacterium]|nr:ABC transporter ATP-binding protein [Chloroflexota bacterium]
MLKLETLEVSYGGKKILDGINLELQNGESLAIIGESGAGKTTLALSLMRLVDGSVKGKILFNGLDLLSLTEEALNELRGNRIALAPQNANNTLNPVHTILNQVAEPIIEHQLKSRQEARQQASILLSSFGIPANRFSAYPHQLSGGEQQRVLLSIASANQPEFLILDEPISSLDAPARAEVIELIKHINQDCSLIIMTHDISTGARLADKAAVLYAGRIAELGLVSEVLTRPRHPYTRGLIRCYPDMATGKDLQGIKGVMDRSVSGCAFHPRCTQAIEICQREVPPLRLIQGRYIACHRGGIIPLLSTKNLSKRFGSLLAVDSVNITIEGGETLALVGESGSGKTTLAKLIMGLIEPTEGKIYLEDNPVRNRGKDFYRQVQMIAQNPGESLSHRLSVLELVREPLDVQEIGAKEERDRQVRQVLREVDLPDTEAFLNEYPHHLSGGEMQRVAIARALVLRPRLLIADEPVAFLDSSLQAKILKLLLHLQEQRGLSLLFITHDIAVARKISDRIAVMKDGRIVEEGPATKIITSPGHTYTQKLSQASLDLSLEN